MWQDWLRSARLPRSGERTDEGASASLLRTGQPSSSRIANSADSHPIRSQREIVEILVELRDHAVPLLQLDVDFGESKTGTDHPDAPVGDGRLEMRLRLLVKTRQEIDDAAEVVGQRRCRLHCESFVEVRKGAVEQPPGCPRILLGLRNGLFDMQARQVHVRRIGPRIQLRRLQILTLCLGRKVQLMQKNRKAVMGIKKPGVNANRRFEAFPRGQTISFPPLRNSLFILLDSSL